MAKTDECDRCQRFSGYLGAEFLVCAVHPSGPAQSPCLDFAKVVNQAEESEGAYYNGELLRAPKRRLTTAQRWEILNTHPLFTGVCPKCGEVILEEGLVNYDCKKCR
jgi:hypothetical protein